MGNGRSREKVGRNLKAATGRGTGPGGAGEKKKCGGKKVGRGEKGEND